ncbi:MAG: hypothetical protein Fur005_06630 [Roseiflexaceae bacterium]
MATCAEEGLDILEIRGAGIFGQCLGCCEWMAIAGEHIVRMEYAKVASFVASITQRHHHIRSGRNVPNDRRHCPRLL